LLQHGLQTISYPSNFRRALSTRKELLFWVFTVSVFSLWFRLSFNVLDGPTWIVENIIPAVLVGPAIWLFRRGVISTVSMVILYLYVSFHLIGAHYTYSLVPYDRIGENIFGFSINTLFGWERNNYDRFVHFLFGLSLYQPTVEILRRYAPSIRGWVLPTFVILLLNAFSVAYEMVEWCASLMLNERTGVDFLGSQGDIWDAHKDMILAFIGSLIAAMIFNGIFAKARTKIRSKLHRRAKMTYIGH
jgi:putative membrane protein